MKLMKHQFWEPIFLSMQIATVAAVIVVIAGTYIGRKMARIHFPGKVLLETFFLSPMVLPPTVVGFFLIIIFGKNSPIGRGVEMVFGHPIMFTWWAAVIASIIVSFPLMYQSAKAGFSRGHVAIEEAARDLGANNWNVFWHVTLPMAFPSLLGGAILSFVRALGEFGATLMFAGNIPGKTQTIPTAIYMAIDVGNMKLAWAWVAATVVLSISFLVLSQKMSEKMNM